MIVKQRRSSCDSATEVFVVLWPAQQLIAICKYLFFFFFFFFFFLNIIYINMFVCWYIIHLK